MSTDKTPSAVWAEQESSKEMQPFYKTLADVQPGGRVRLGDQAERARFEAWAEGASLNIARFNDGGYCDERTVSAWLAWLSAQPSPGGQDALIDALADDVESCVSDACGYLASSSGWDDYGIYRDDAAERYRALPDRIRELAARQPVDPERGHIDPSWSLHDRVEFALRDAGFDLDEAAFVAESVTAHQNAAVSAFSRQPVELIAQKVGDYRVTVAEDAITVSRGRDIVFAYSAGDAEPINARQPVGDCSESALYEAVGNLLEAPGSWASGYTDALHDLREAYSRYGQKPVMQGPLAQVSSKSFNSDGTSNIITPALPLGTKLYASPAQAVDLGQLSDLHVATLRDMREHMAAGTLSLNDWKGFGTATLDAVLALIDSRR